MSSRAVEKSASKKATRKHAAGAGVGASSAHPSSAGSASAAANAQLIAPASPLFGGDDKTPAAHHAQAPSAAAHTAHHAAALAHLPRFLHPLHRCRFSTFLPSAIISLAFSPNGSRLAIGRQNGNIEIWKVSLGVAGTGTGTNGWVLLKTIPGSGEPTVQVLKWARAKRGAERLFSAGLNGRLIEWDLLTLAPKYASDTYGGAVWCGAIHQKASLTDAEQEGGTMMALGCEDGTIRLFDLSDVDQPPMYLKCISRHTSRVLSIAYSPDGEYLVTGGSEGMIKLWDVAEGRNIQRITVENKGLKRTTVASAGAKKGGPKGKSSEDDRYVTLIWCVQFLTPGTIMSGDSLGNIQIWDLEFGVLKQSFPKALQGDVLSLVVAEGRKVVYAAGVEGKIVELKCVGTTANADEMADEGGAGETKWILTANHRQHTHDVYALAISPTQCPLAAVKQPANAAAAVTPAPLANNYLLVSGGVDTQLLLSPTGVFPEYSSISRLLPFPQGKNGVVVADRVGAGQQPRFLVTHEQHLQLYGLGNINYAETTEALRSKTLTVKETENLPVEKGYVHLLDINVNSRKSIDTSNPSASIWVPGGGLNLICSTLSPSSEYVACSDPIQTKLYKVQPRQASSSPNQLQVTKVQVSHLVNPASAMVFSADSTKLFLASLGGSVQILDLSTLDVQSLEAHLPQAVYEGDLSSESEGDEADHEMDTADEVKSSVKGKKAKKASAQVGLLRTLAVSHDQQYLAVADDLNHIWLYNLDAMSLHATLPTFAQAHLCMEFHPTNSSLLAVLCGKNTLYLYDAEKQQLTDYSKANLGGLSSTTMQTQMALARDQFTRLTFDRSSLTNSNSLMLQSINHLCHVNLDKPKPKDGIVLPGAIKEAAALNRRERKRKAEEAAAGLSSASAPGVGVIGSSESDVPLDPLQVNFRLINRFRPMLYGGFVDESGDNSEAAQKANKAQLKALGGEKKRKKGADQQASNPTEEPTTGDSEPNSERPIVVGSSLLVLEAPWLNILQQLPQPMARHRYGT